MLNQLLNWRFDTERRRNRMRSVVLLSLILHMLIAIVYLFLPLNQLSNQQEDAFAVDLINDAEAPRKRSPKPKPPLTKKLYDPNEQLARNAQDRKIETTRNKIDEVMKLSPRVVLKDVEVNKAPLSEIIPDVMTDAQLREAEASNLSRLISQPGQTDGRGIVTGRVRARGDEGMGRFRGSGQGGGDGLLGGGGKDGAADRLGIINFLNEHDGPKDVVYCLDITASMQAAGMKKLPLAINALRDSVMMLGNDDRLNIVAFSDTAKPMSEEMLPANTANIKRVLKYLDKFTPESIQGNLDTNILLAIKAALMFEPTVVVLITDGLPVADNDDDRAYIEANPQKILDAVRESNHNNTVIYVVALEFDPKHSPAAKLLVPLAEEHNGEIKMIDSDLLFEYAEQEGLDD